MRFSTDLGARESDLQVDTDDNGRAITLDVFMGIAAGLALVLAILLLASMTPTPAVAHDTVVAIH